MLNLCLNLLNSVFLCSFYIPSGLHLTIAEGLPAEHSVLQITLEASKCELLEKLQAAFKHFMEQRTKFAC